MVPANVTPEQRRIIAQVQQREAQSQQRYSLRERAFNMFAASSENIFSDVDSTNPTIQSSAGIKIYDEYVQALALIQRSGADAQSLSLLDESVNTLVVSAGQLKDPKEAKFLTDAFKKIRSDLNVLRAAYKDSRPKDFKERQQLARESLGAIKRGLKVRRLEEFGDEVKTPGSSLLSASTRYAMRSMSQSQPIMAAVSGARAGDFVGRGLQAGLGGLGDLTGSGILSGVGHIAGGAARLAASSFGGLMGGAVGALGSASGNPVRTRLLAYIEGNIKTTQRSARLHDELAAHAKRIQAEQELGLHKDNEERRKEAEGGGVDTEKLKAAMKEALTETAKESTQEKMKELLSKLFGIVKRNVVHVPRRTSGATPAGAYDYEGEFSESTQDANRPLSLPGATQASISYIPDVQNNAQSGKLVAVLDESSVQAIRQIDTDVVDWKKDQAFRDEEEDSFRKDELGVLNSMDDKLDRMLGIHERAERSGHGGFGGSGGDSGGESWWSKFGLGALFGGGLLKAWNALNEKLGKGFSDVEARWEKFKTGLGEKWETFKTDFSSKWEKIKTRFGDFEKTASEAGKTLRANVGAKLAKAGEAISKVIKPLAPAAKAAGSVIGGIFKNPAVKFVGKAITPVAGMVGAAEGYGTSTEAYRARFGLDPEGSSGVLEDTAIRTLGVGADVAHAMIPFDLDKRFSKNISEGYDRQRAYETKFEGKGAHVVKGAISEAAKKTGVPESFLLAMARQESTFNPAAHASKGSASGLFQFTDSTWAAMLKAYPQLRGKDRSDPEASALAAALLAKENMKILKAAGLPINADTLYAAHMLGPGTAKRVLMAPDFAIGTKLVSGTAAANNRNVFYDKANNERTVGDIKRLLFGKVGRWAGEYEAMLGTEAGQNSIVASIQSMQTGVSSSQRLESGSATLASSHTAMTAASTKASLIVASKPSAPPVVNVSAPASPPPNVTVAVNTGQDTVAHLTNANNFYMRH